jgi:hypothetical protein
VEAAEMTQKSRGFSLNRDEHRLVSTLFHSGQDQNRVQTRARILDLWDRQMPQAEIAPVLSAYKMVLGQDNLNPHTAGAFYHHLPPADACAVAQRFEFHYPPQKGSWLNSAALALSALARLCLSRRLGSLEALDREVQILVTERNAAQTEVNWQVSLTQAREKLPRHYEKVNTKN